MIVPSRPVPPPPKRTFMSIAQDTIKPGMLVKLKSGSPLMTADSVRDGKMFCMYFVGTEAKWITIAREALVEIKEHEVTDERPSDTD